MKIWFKHKATELSLEIRPSLLRFALNMVIAHADSIQSFIDSLPW